MMIEAKRVEEEGFFFVIMTYCKPRHVDDF